MKKLLLSVIAGATVLAGCGNNTDLIAPLPPAQAQVPPANFTQVEFLARPAIAEGLLFSNDLLATYNAVPPRFVAAALADPNSPQGQAAAPIFAEATAVLNILTGLVPAGPTTGEVVAGFLPDVQRIDTSLNFSPNTDGTETSAYGSVFDTAGLSPVSGRKLTDDTIDITLNFLTGGAVPSDGVPYYNPGNGNAAIGHSRLNGETVNFGPSTFPYLAPAQ